MFHGWFESVWKRAGRSDGHKLVPTPWMDADKDEDQKSEGMRHEILHKSRLITRGDLQLALGSHTMKSGLIYQPSRRKHWTSYRPGQHARVWRSNRSTWLWDGYRSDVVLKLPMMDFRTATSRKEPWCWQKWQCLAGSAGRRFLAAAENRAITSIGFSQGSQCQALVRFAKEGVWKW